MERINTAVIDQPDEQKDAPSVERHVPKSVDLKEWSHMSEGAKLESLFVEKIECGWDGEKWVNLGREGKGGEATALLEAWFEEHNISYPEWNRFSPTERRKILIDWVKENQPMGWDAGEPPVLKTILKGREVDNTLPHVLHGGIADALGLETYSHLKMYSTAGTPLDTLYGFDALLEIEDPHHEEALPQGERFTLDITRNSQKISGERKSKADFVFTLHNEDSEGNYRIISVQEAEDEGKRIADAFKDKIRFSTSAQGKRVEGGRVPRYRHRKAG